MKSFLMSALAGLGLDQLSMLKLMGAPEGWRPGTASRKTGVSARLKKEFREANPGVSLDMHRYARRYQNPGVNRRVRPFSAK